MEQIGDKIIEKSSKYCMHCMRNTPLPNEYEWTVFSCRYNVVKRKRELTKIQRKLKKYAEMIILSICIDIYKIHKGDDTDILIENIATLKQSTY